MEAQNTWLRSDQTRLHPFNASILYKLGACCLDQGKVEASMYDYQLPSRFTFTLLTSNPLVENTLRTL